MAENVRQSEESFTRTRARLNADGTRTVAIENVSHIRLPEAYASALRVDDVGYGDGLWDSITLWDQPDGKGNSINLQYTGNALLTDFFRYVEYTPQGEVYHDWGEAVRSYQAPNLMGSFAGGTPVRHEQFGLNYNVVNAGRVAGVATKIYITWMGVNEFFASGMIANWPSLGSGLWVPDDQVMSVLPGQAVNGGRIRLFGPGDYQNLGPNPWPLQEWHWDNGVIVHVASGKCLDVPGSSTANGTLLQLWDRNGGPNQTWSYDPQLKHWRGIGGKCIEVGPTGFLQISDSVGGKPEQLWRNYFY